MRMIVEGAEVELTKVVLQWDNRRDDTIKDFRPVSRGSTTPKDAPGRKGRLTAVTVEYKIVGEAPDGLLKVGDTTERGVNTDRSPCASSNRPHAPAASCERQSPA